MRGILRKEGGRVREDGRKRKEKQTGRETEDIGVEGQRESRKKNKEEGRK